ncbi:MAG: glycerol-3-phosphate 1-O-acyltransferase [Verrucomicrobia bacterium]|jgi:glycerol-3-phosphate acyltransferase PlsY|nr:glycerol-3-phosphate 1-O-acyltransferase [Verrucomicrobiota bacterium]
MQNPVFYVLTAFFLGSLPFGYWLALLRGVDLRKQGSGNTGATNVGRVLGKKWGIFVFALDLGKGWLAVALAKSVGNVPETWSITVGVFAVLGHIFSPWLGFRGGKGVATSAGILIGLAPWVALGVALIWFLAFQMSRTVSVASLCAATAFPLFVFWLMPDQKAFQWISLGMAVLVWFRHRDNLKRLLQGKENRFVKPEKP